jgi:hypothetical protein
LSYYLIENFANGLDLRRSVETAPPGSLRVLKNAFINEGGEIERRKAFSLEPTLTAYAQTYKGKVTGPHEVPGYPNSAFFRHRENVLPALPFEPGAGTEAKKIVIGEGYQALTFWAMKSATALTNFGALMHTASYSQFSSKGYVIESYLDAVTRARSKEHFSITFTNGEPTAQTLVSANAGRDYQMTLDDKGYVIKGDVFYASAVADPADMAGTGATSVNITTKGPSIGGSVSLGDYFGQLAIFGRRGVQFYAVDPDPDKIQYQRTVSASVFAPRSVTGYADGDIVFLGKNGIRSLQARDSSNLAAVSDVGSPIDRELRTLLEFGFLGYEPLLAPTNPDEPISDFLDLAVGIVVPDSGQLWMSIADRIYCLTRHPAASVQAWSTYSLPAPDPDRESGSAGRAKSFWISDICAIGETVMFRNFADEVFIYGGLDGVTYDKSPAEVVLPFLDMEKPGTNKYFNGIDVVCEGEWEVFISTVAVADQQSMIWEKVADLTGRTRTQTRVPFQAQGTQIALKFVSTSPYAARIAQVGVFYEMGSDK